MEFPISQKARRTKPQPIGYLMAQGVAGDVISLAAGLVDAESLPADQILDVMPQFLRERGRAALQYGTAEGLLSLRTKVLDILLADDLKTAKRPPLERVLLSTGSQQMLYILTEVMVDPGDIVITPAPTYFVYLGALDSMGAEVISIPSDDKGMRIDLLAEKLGEFENAGRGGRVKIIYMDTYFQNPSGVSLSVERRKALVETVKSFAGMHPLIIEDAAYRELRYDAADTPSIWSFDEGGERVAHIGTFSKPFSPGLRTGFAVLPEAICGKVALLKLSHDFGSANFCQHLIDFAIEKGVYKSHVEALRRRYAGKRDLTCGCLRREIGSAASWTTPEGGLYVWADLPGEDTRMGSRFHDRCLEERFLYVPGDLCYPKAGAAPVSRMRLSFGQACQSDIEEGIKRLARALSRNAAGA